MKTPEPLEPDCFACCRPLPAGCADDGIRQERPKDHFRRGMDYEKAQQWEKAAQEFTLAVAADPSNAEFQLHYRRAIFNASQMFMQQGRSLAEQRDYVGAYNAFRQAFGYDPVNQLAVSEMERMLRLQEVKEGGAVTDNGSSTERHRRHAGRSVKAGRTSRCRNRREPEQLRQGNFNGDLKHYIRTLAEQLGLNVDFRQAIVCATAHARDGCCTQPSRRRRLSTTSFCRRVCSSRSSIGTRSSSPIRHDGRSTSNWLCARSSSRTPILKR